MMRLDILALHIVLLFGYYMFLLIWWNWCTFTRGSEGSESWF